MTSPDGVSAAGSVWRGMAADLLQCEFDRRKAFEGRGAALLTASATLSTLIFGLAILVTGKDPVFKNLCAQCFLGAALAGFIASAVFAILVQARGFDFLAVSEKSLLNLTGRTMWNQTADYAVRSDVAQKTQMICSLRKGNDRMALWVKVSLWLQLAAIGLLSCSVGIELFDYATARPH
jgi:hypothetical protein